MTTYDIKKIKEKQKLVKLANYGSQVRKKMRPKVLIGDGKDKKFIEGDILDANAVHGLIEDTYDKSRVFRAFAREGKEIDKNIKYLLEKINEDYEQLSSTIADNKKESDIKLELMSGHIDDIESNIPNLRRVVDIQPYKISEDGTKTYLVTKLGDVQEEMYIEGGKKGEKGDKGDPFTYDDFTEEQIENLKVKGDRGVSIIYAKQTKVSYVSNGINEYTIMLDDGTVTVLQVRNGKKGEVSYEYFNKNAVCNGTYDKDSLVILLLNGNGETLAAIDAKPFIKDGMVNDAKVEDGYLIITFNTDAGKLPIKIPVVDIFNPNNYYTKDEVEQLIDNAVADERERAEAAEQILLENIEAEEGARIQAIAEEAKDRKKADQLLNKDLTAECERAKDAEQTLQDAIDAERDRATQAEEDLKEDIKEAVENAMPKGGLPGQLLGTTENGTEWINRWKTLESNN